MKTYNILSKRFSLFLFAGILSSVFISCGTYQNSSYQDRDGIYSNTQRPKSERSSTDNNSTYKNYFDSKQDSELFVDVDNYSSNEYDENNPESTES